MARWLTAVVALMAVGVADAARACPADSAPRAQGTLLEVQVAGSAPLALGAADLGALPQTTLTQRQSVTASTPGAGSERSIRYAGVTLRELLLRAGVGRPDDRGARVAVVEAVATDGYRAVFSWGELFNTAVGEQVLVVVSSDGQPLDAFVGPLALRSLADFRPGPRHVRNLCALVVRR
jgi:hypothetical protein